MNNNIEIKKVLEDIVFYTYKKEVSQEIYRKMLKFYIKFENKILNSYHGFYKYKDSSITIVNLYRTPTQIICTTIHELSHHVDYVLRGKTDHSKEFYHIFTKLLYTGLNMNLFSKKEALLMETDASDSRKVKKIIDQYVPNPIPYKQNEQKIIVNNGYAIKDILKENGFHYNDLSNTWENTVSKTDLPQFENLLKKLACDFNIVDAGMLNVEATGILIATSTDSYKYKEDLKANGFVWNPHEKRWQKKIKMPDYDKEMLLLRHLNTKIPIQLAKEKKKKARS